MLHTRAHISAVHASHIERTPKNKTHKGVCTVRRVETAGVAVQVEASVHVRSDVATDAFRRKIHFDDLLMFVIVVV